VTVGDDEAASRACEACEEWWAICHATRLPSEYPQRLRLSTWDAFRFNVGVLRAARRARMHELSEARSKLQGDDFGIGAITGTLAFTYAKG
jgi:hypothetical protein